MTDNPFIDILVSNIKTISFSCVVKDEYTADNSETVESLKESELYISCVEKHAELGLFPKIPHKFLVQVGVPSALISQYEKEYDQIYIPDIYHAALVKLLIPWYIENYDEKNEYYRMITGLPPKGDPGIPIRDYEYLIPDYITYEGDFFHEVGYQVNRSFEEEGVLDVVRAEYPEYKYLNYLTQGITIYDARKKMDFQILFCTDQMNPAVTEEFRQKYDECRKFVINTQYSLAYDIENPYYHSFMLAYCMLITMIDMLVEVQAHIVKKDILDRRCIQYIFSMYGIPYYRTIPYKYQERLCKNVHNLVKYKSCDQGFMNLTKLFGFEDLEIFKWFIIKARRTNPWGEFLYNTTTQMVCQRNDFIQHDTISYNMSDAPTRGKLPDDMAEMSEFFGGMGAAPPSTKYVDRYIPFPFQYYLQKGNVMIVRLDDYVLKEDIDYIVYDYNIIRFLNGIAYGKSKITYDFYYDINTISSNDFPYDNSYRIETHIDKGEATDDDHVFDLTSSSLTDFFITEDKQFEVILNGVWLDPTLYFVDYTDRTITIDSSIPLDKWTDDLNFVCIRPVGFKSIYDKQEVNIDTNAQPSIDIPEPFTDYIVNGNEFFLTKNDIPVDPSEYTINPASAKVIYTDPSTLVAGDKMGFHFFYSDQSLITSISVVEQVITVTSTETYQYEFHVDFPVSHYVECGYKVYIKLLGWWLPAKFFTIVGNDTIVFLDKSISMPKPGRTMEVHFVYMPYDATDYVNFKTSSAYEVSKADFQKNFTLEVPFEDFFAKGNKVVIDSEGILLKEGVDYTLTQTDTTTYKVTIPNRDYRPMKGNRVTYTFFYNDNSATQIGVSNKILGTLATKSDQFMIPFPFYPYLETGHGFVLQVGNKTIQPENIKMVDRFHCKILDLENSDIGKTVSVVFFYNQYYLTHQAGNFVVEWRQQDITGPEVEMDTPAELYVENKWPYFVTYGDRKYIEDTKYDVINHTFYSNPMEDLANGVYGSYLNFVYIYTKKEGYMEEANTEVHSSNTDMYFSKAPISDLYQIQYIKDKTNWRGYDVITSADGWWDGEYYKQNAHEVIKHDIYQKKFNYERTKYYGVSNTIDLGEYSNQMSYFYSMLYDDVFLEEEVDLLIPVLSASHRFKLSHLLVYMTVLTYLFNGFEDFIIDKPSKLMFVNGFNFKTDLDYIKDYLRIRHQHKSDFPIWDYILPTTQIPDIVQFVNVFKENYAVRKTICKHMVLASDYREYVTWKKIYDSMMIWKLNQEFFRKTDGTIADTYTDFLKDKDGLLYTSIQDLKALTDTETLQDTIINITDSIVYIMEEYLSSEEFKYLYASLPGQDSSKAAKYLHMMIDFFKSYKIVLMPRTETMNINDPDDPDNYFQGRDQIETILETTRTADYIQPVEKVDTTEHMLLMEWVEEPDETMQVIEYKYPTFHANDSDKPLKIRSTGRWMKEDVSIEPYGKSRVRYDIYPCRITVNKIPYNFFLDSKFTFEPSDHETLLEATATVNKEPFALNPLTGHTSIDAIPFETTDILFGSVTLDGKLFLSGYKMMTVYRPIYQTMTTIPLDDISDLNDRIDIQKGPDTVTEMFKNSYKMTIVPTGLNFTNSVGELYYNDFSDFCMNCYDLIKFPFKTQFFAQNDDDKNFDRMFYNCEKLKKIDNFELAEYIGLKSKISFRQAFYNCVEMESSIKLIRNTNELDLTELFYNAKKLVDPPIINTMYGPLHMSRAFYKCYSLTASPDIYFPTTNPSFPTAATVDLTRTFEGCSSISSYQTMTGLDYEFTDVEVMMDQTFLDCTSMPKGMTCKIKGSQVHMIETYKGCTAMVQSANLYLSNSSNVLLDRTYKDNKNISYASRIECTDAGSEVHMDNTFEGCTSLIDIRDLFDSTSGNFYLNETFKGCTRLVNIKIDMARVKSWNNIFVGCTSLVSVTFLNTTPAMQIALTHAALDGGTLTYAMTYL